MNPTLSNEAQIVHDAVALHKGGPGSGPHAGAGSRKEQKQMFAARKSADAAKAGDKALKSGNAKDHAAASAAHLEAAVAHESVGNKTIAANHEKLSRAHADRSVKADGTTDLEKGDVAGHEFHGNQYSQGAGKNHSGNTKAAGKVIAQFERGGNKADNMREMDAQDLQSAHGLNAAEAEHVRNHIGSATGSSETPSFANSTTGPNGFPSDKAMAAESTRQNAGESDKAANEKFKGATAEVHAALTSAGYQRDAANDIKGREGMRAYTHANGSKVLQSSGLTIHTTASGKKTVYNSVEQAKAKFGGKK